MNRTIKFRGKEAYTGKWLIGALVPNGKHPCIAPFGELFHLEEINSETVGQFTGLLDRNGKEIYDGDIVKFHFITSQSYTTELFPTEKLIGEVTVNKYNQWIILSDGIEIHIENAVKYGEIIGNRFDTPDLLNSK